MISYAINVRRIITLAALAVVVPVSAFALTGGGSTTAPAGLSVSASLGSCGVAEEQIYCAIDVAFTGVPGAEYYTASVTRADGSVQDFGQVAQGESGGGTSLWVPYVGAGTYTVRVAAYGTPPGEDDGRPELLDEGSAEPSNDFKPLPNKRERGSAPGGKQVVVPGSHSRNDDRPAQQGPAGTQPPAGEEPAPAEPAPAPEVTPEPAPEAAPTEPPTQTLPECQPAPPPPPPDGSQDPSAPEATAPAPAPSVECTEPSTDYQGPCCPPGA